MTARAHADFAVRTDLGGVASDAGGEPLLSLVHLSDLHVLDAASPARAEWVELEGDDPLMRPLLHMHRPYDTLTAFALHAHVRTVAAVPAGPATGRAHDIAISTGDNIDNAQRNELDAYLAVFAGGVARLDAHGSAQDSSTGEFDAPWPFWSPDPAIDDRWRSLGYPAVTDLIDRASAAIVSSGIGMPWTSVPGNHDLMRQGTALPNPLIDAIAVAPSKSLRRPIGFAPADPLSLYVDEPEVFSEGPTFDIVGESDRRSIDRREWIEAHVAAGALGYNEANVASATIDSVIDLDHVRLILLDTNHPEGDYQGSIGSDQLTWLDERLTEVGRDPGRYAILVSHHGVGTLVNERGSRHDRLLGDSLDAVIHRHPCAIAWLVGHRHVNRIEARPGTSGGYWEITTCSTIDWPSQTRAVELVSHVDGSLELICTLQDHDDRADTLAGLHRDLAHRFTTTGVATRMSGREGDGNVRLLLPPRRRG